MTTIHLSLTRTLMDRVEERVQHGPYVDAGEYLRELIRADAERASHVARLQGLVTKGFDGGVSDRSMDEIREHARARAARPDGK